MAFLLRAWLVLKYLALGCFIWLAGALFFGSGTAFQSRSEPAALVVVDVRTERDAFNLPRYRPTFAVEAHAPPRAEYTGHILTRIKPHEPGDVVPGRHDPGTGEMRSDKMLRRTIWTGWVAKTFGCLVGIQAVLIAFGIPESRLPLRVRVGSRRRHTSRI